MIYAPVQLVQDLTSDRYDRRTLLSLLLAKDVCLKVTKMLHKHRNTTASPTKHHQMVS